MEVLISDIGPHSTLPDIAESWKHLPHDLCYQCEPHEFIKVTLFLFSASAGLNITGLY